MQNAQNKFIHALPITNESKTKKLDREFLKRKQEKKRGWLKEETGI